MTKLVWNDLREAVLSGNLEVLKNGVAEGFPMASQSCGLLQLAAKSGHSHCVEFLIPLSLSDEQGVSSALQWASEWGRLDCVKLLSSHADPKDDESWALDLALRNGHLDVAEFLYPLSDVDALHASIGDGDEAQLSRVKAFLQMMKLKELHLPSDSIHKPKRGL